MEDTFLQRLERMIRFIWIVKSTTVTTVVVTIVTIVTIFNVVAAAFVVVIFVIAYPPPFASSESGPADGVEEIEANSSKTSETGGGVEGVDALKS